jgi:hypothetical protein
MPSYKHEASWSNTRHPNGARLLSILNTLLYTCLLVLAVQSQAVLAWGSNGNKIVAMQKTPFNATTIAMESCNIVSPSGFYPDRLVTPEYVDRYVPFMAHQLAAAGRRLAQVLNELK